MFGWVGRRGRQSRAVARLVAADGDPRVVFSELPANERDAIFTAAIRELLLDDRVPEAVVVSEARLETGPDTEASLLVADDVFAEAGDVERCVAVCERLVVLSDEAVLHMVRLAQRLISVGTPREALEVLDMIPASEASWLDSAEVRAEALVALDQPAVGLGILRDLMAHDQRSMKTAMDSFTWRAARDRSARVRPLHDALIAQTQGAEQVVVAALRSGTLDPHAAVNFKLLANSLMVHSDYVPHEFRLVSPETVLAAGYDERDPWSVARFAEAKLRTGAVRDAKHLFERSRDLDGRCFAAYRGLAGVGSVQYTRTFERVDALPRGPLPTGIEEVVGDWGALTEVERRIVVASVLPLRRFLRSLRDVGGRMAILPIDVRTVDLPALRGLAGHSFDDHRHFAALGGVAAPAEQLATSRIEELLGFGDAGGLVFAHEFAHLAYYGMPEDNPFRELHHAASESPHVGTNYELSNEDEFFACAYESYLARQWDLPQERVEDDAGIYAEVFACLDEIARDDEPR